MEKKLEKCACGCGHSVPNPPYESNGKKYASAYCILSQSETCSYCGGYYGKDFNPNKHEYKCRCNWEDVE